MNTQDASAIIDGAISKMDLLIAQNQRLIDALTHIADLRESEHGVSRVARVAKEVARKALDEMEG